METKAPSASAASLLARLKPRPVRPQPRVQIEQPTPGDGRRSRRQATCLQAAIHCERLSEPVACVIRNLSATGARIEIVRGERKPFTTEERIPDLFTLGFRLERTEVDCELIWRRGDVIGVKFRSLPRQARA
ncbi:MAG: PilZ domain-containing protein [Hyphomicrobiaceae bacterium]